MTDESGAQQIEYRYEAFGDLRQHDEHATSAPSNYLRYTGEYYDTFTETYHLRARQYDTHLGRFNQTDQHRQQSRILTCPGTPTQNNQATRLTDPSGRVTEESIGPDGSLFFWKDEVTNSGSLEFIANGFTSAAFILACIDVVGPRHRRRSPVLRRGWSRGGIFHPSSNRASVHHGHGNGN